MLVVLIMGMFVFAFVWVCLFVVSFFLVLFYHFLSWLFNKAGDVE